MSGLGSMIDLVETRGLRAGEDRGCGVEPASSSAAESILATDRGGGIGGAAVRRVIEAEIVPRLLLSVAPSEASPARARVPSPDDVAEMARIVVAHDLDTARSFMTALEGSGMEREGVLLDVLGPTAHLLGELWNADRCTFAEVTVGLSRLQTLALELSRSVEEAREGRARGRVLLAAVPGEQHTLGLRLLTDLLRADAWLVTDLVGADREELVRVVAELRYDAIGLTLSNDALLPDCGALIADLRSASCHPEPLVLVGGAVRLEPRDLKRLGADATAFDGREVVRLMRKLHERASSSQDARRA